MKGEFEWLSQKPESEGWSSTYTVLPSLMFQVYKKYVWNANMSLLISRLPWKFKYNFSVSISQKAYAENRYLLNLELNNSMTRGLSLDHNPLISTRATLKFSLIYEYFKNSLSSPSTTIRTRQVTSYNENLNKIWTLLNLWQIRKTEMGKRSITRPD